MKTRTIFISLSIVFFFCACKTNEPRTFEKLSIKTLKIDSSSIRAIHVLPDSTVFYATSKGTIGMTMGFKHDPTEIEITHDTIIPHFRAIASNGESIFALSIGNPALLFNYTDNKATVVYKEKHEKVFYDAMAFFDTNHGIAMGDPTEDCLSIILTNDGGNTWTKMSAIRIFTS